jgi:predicted AAA+ superfamily ATPase
MTYQSTRKNFFTGGLIMPEKTSEQEIKEIWKLFHETAISFKETDRRFKETDKKIKELSDLFTSQWGKLIEALVKPGVLKHFIDRNIKVSETQQRVESVKNGGKMEVDLLLTNDQEVVVIEVKTTLKVEDVREFLIDLDNFLKFFPRYRGQKIYAAVAALTIVEDADRFAYRQGLFVLRLGKDNMIEMLNDSKFIPKDFGKRP